MSAGSVHHNKIMIDNLINEIMRITVGKRVGKYSDSSFYHIEEQISYRENELKLWKYSAKTRNDIIEETMPEKPSQLELKQCAMTGIWRKAVYYTDDTIDNNIRREFPELFDTNRFWAEYAVKNPNEWYFKRIGLGIYIPYRIM